MNKVDTYIESLPGWQKEFLTIFRDIIHKEAESVQEDWKWNVPVFLIDSKPLFAMAAFKSHVKYNFIGNGALLDDPHKLFNNGFDSKKSRGIDLHEGDVPNVAYLTLLVKSALQEVSS